MYGHIELNVFILDFDTRWHDIMLILNLDQDAYQVLVLGTATAMIYHPRAMSKTK